MVCGVAPTLQIMFSLSWPRQLLVSCCGIPYARWDGLNVVCSSWQQPFLVMVDFHFTLYNLRLVNASCRPPHLSDARPYKWLSKPFWSRSSKIVFSHLHQYMHDICESEYSLFLPLKLLMSAQDFSLADPFTAFSAKMDWCLGTLLYSSNHESFPTQTACSRSPNCGTRHPGWLMEILFEI